jgi:flagellar biogenesis protein FliO
MDSKKVQPMQVIKIVTYLSTTTNKDHSKPMQKSFRVYGFMLLSIVIIIYSLFLCTNLMSKQGQNVKPTQDANANTSPNVIANAARFNTQFINMQIGGNPITVSIGKLLTVMGEQDNTIRILSKAMGQNYDERQMHDMHNSLFGGLLSGSGTGKEGIDLSSLLTQLTAFINQQNQQIQTLIAAIVQDVRRVTSQVQSSTG